MPESTFQTNDEHSRDGRDRTVGGIGAVLAGGASRRMGHDKARLRLDGQSLAARAVECLKQVVDEVVVADRGRRLVRGVSSIADGPGAGPAAGILGVAAAYPGRPLLVLACDLPGVPAAFLAALLDEPGDFVVASRGGRLEPLAALYRPAALAALAEQVRGGVSAIKHLVEAPGLAVQRLDEDALADRGFVPEIFQNLNTPADLKAFASRNNLRGKVLDG